MRRKERVFRIVVGTLLLIIAKALLLASSLYIKTLVEKSAANIGDRSMSTGVVSSFLGLFLGVGMTRIVSGIVQLVCDLILSPAVNSAGIGLPKEAFSAALAGTYSTTCSIEVCRLINIIILHSNHQVLVVGVMMVCLSKYQR
jgi:hypothetical protein